jgi:hypothetical protein
MSFEIPPNHKFALMALHGPQRLSDDIGDGLEVAEGTWMFGAPPVDLGEWWSEGLGSFELETYRNSQLFLLSMAPSQAPALLDRENTRLERELHGFLYGLLLHEAARSWNARLAKGARIGDKSPEPRQVSQLPPCYPHAGGRQPIIDGRMSGKAHRIGREILRLYDQVPDETAPLARVQEHSRLRRGFNALLRGLRERDGAPRLHNFVRSLEAITHPEEGRTARQWVHRCQTFAGAAARPLLAQMYDLRSAEEHLNDFRVVLENPHATLRVYQAEVLACYVFRRLFSEPGLLANFVGDEAADAFWRSQKPAPAKVWGETLDICEEALRAAGRLPEE